MPFTDFTQLPLKEIAPGFEARFIHTENLTMAFVTIEKGSILPEHFHFNEQITHVVEGQLEFTLNGETQILENGKVVIIPSNMPHSAIALSDCNVIDVFYPVREDYKALTDKD